MKENLTVRPERRVSLSPDLFLGIVEETECFVIGRMENDADFSPLLMFDNSAQVFYFLSSVSASMKDLFKKERAKKKLINELEEIIKEYESRS